MRRGVRRDNPNDTSDRAMLVNAEEASHRAALWELEGSSERTLPELFSTKYADLLKQPSDCLKKRIG